ncbi:hypothetical protein HJC23_003683 [Cyclotella cryptica]|uniref:Uncharacterized protein n=1 Tax=Cyclotella cryptica TaxID=29204 RepID=A0ABD3P1J7_9STRA
MKVLLSPHPRSKPRPILHILPLHCTRRTTALDTTTEISLGGIKKGTKTIARHALTTNEKNNISQNDFLWAMEAVHSRAFRGDFGALNNIDNEGGGLLLILTMIADRTGSNRDAVLLPLIDSANHLQEADSVNEYDPVVDGYVLSLGRKCLVKEVDEGMRERAQDEYGMYPFGKKCDVHGNAPSPNQYITTKTHCIFRIAIGEVLPSSPKKSSPLSIEALHTAAAASEANDFNQEYKYRNPAGYTNGPVSPRIFT